MSGRPVRWALRLYPRRWRQRYGGEVRDLADELVSSGESSGSRAAGGIVLAAAREHWRAMRRHRRAIGVLGGAVVVVAGVLAATTLGDKGPTHGLSAHGQASRATFIAFIDPEASTQEISALGRDLAGWEPEQVKSCRYVDKAQSFAEFKQKFRADPDILKGITEEQMPPSFRCTLAQADGLFPVASKLVAEPGIYSVAKGTVARRRR
jgi:cell division protein FtsX